MSGDATVDCGVRSVFPCETSLIIRGSRRCRSIESRSTYSGIVGAGTESALAPERSMAGAEVRSAAKAASVPPPSALSRTLSTPPTSAQMPEREPSSALWHDMTKRESSLTAAKDLGLTAAVPARIEVLADARLKPIKIASQEIHFTYAAPNRLDWADRAAMRVVRRCTGCRTGWPSTPTYRTCCGAIFADPIHGRAIRHDLRGGFSALPIWMQEFWRGLLDLAAQGTAMTAAAYKEVIAASSRDRLDLFLATANRLGAPIGNVENEFWVCWMLNALYH
jgi:hypothetical protein